MFLKIEENNDGRWRHFIHDSPVEHLGLHTSTNEVKNWITIMQPIIHKSKERY